MTKVFLIINDNNLLSGHHGEVITYPKNGQMKLFVIGNIVRVA